MFFMEELSQQSLAQVQSLLPLEELMEVATNSRQELDFTRFPLGEVQISMVISQEEDQVEQLFNSRYYAQVELSSIMEEAKGFAFLLEVKLSFEFIKLEQETIHLVL